MNEPLLRQVQAMILRYPGHVDMRQWVLGTLTADKHAGPPCGTTGCIAGWARAIADGAVRIGAETSAEFERHARDLLDLVVAEAHRLFFETQWPGQFQYLYVGTAIGSPERAQVIAQRIEHFIESGGVE